MAETSVQVLAAEASFLPGIALHKGIPNIFEKQGNPGHVRKSISTVECWHRG
jgi:hypothetical protein